jgi:lipopolysaccharide export system permease protein
MKIIDRYLLKQFLQTLFFSILSLCLVFLVVNLLESLDEFLDQKASLNIIIEYYAYFFPEILKILTPVAMLLSTLFTVGRLSVNNEIIAMKSGSLSLYRFMLPLIIVGILISLGQLYFNGWIVPRANERKIEIERKYLNKGDAGGPIYNLYFRDSPQRIVIMQYYNANTKSGHKIAIEDYSSELKPRMVKRIEAEKIIWDTTDNNWKLLQGIDRIFNNGLVSAKRYDTLNVNLNIKHNQIQQLNRSIEEMNFDELKIYIDLIQRGGKDVRQLRINYYGEYALPFANFIVILFGVPFASIRKKGGMAIQIGAAMVISFLYLVFTKLSQTIGYSTDYNPVLTAWMANILFFIAGIINLVKTPT